MKNTLPLMLLIFCVIGCDRFGGRSETTSNTGNTSNSVAPATPVAKIVDMPSLLGKSKDEVKKLVTGRLSADATDEIKFEFPQGRLTVSFNPGIGRPIAFALPLSTTNVESSGDSKERLGELVGIDMKGRTPTKTDNFGTHYENETINGKNVRIVFTPTMPGKDKFYEVRVSPKSGA